MENIMQRLDQTDWQAVAEGMHGNGYALLPGLLDRETCRQLITDYDNAGQYRKTIVMERYRFGLGEYKYFRYPLPPLIQAIREKVYPQLAPVANAWMDALDTATRFPDDLISLQHRCNEQGQSLPAVLILKYGAGGHNTLHQDLYGDVFFPIQMVLFLDEPGKDYTGGEFVLTEQVPRAQSKAIVLQPGQGDALLFTTSFRPVKGARGYYRAHMKHGISAVHTGQRHTLGIIFHDAGT
ncbi:2OG-Fe(II) oxygenase [Taibaiella koreensis]|uniref:2OG-Fe(II) oxygenase n=1 Tax=Taibaiella koreensis TaxID=1268548 RepID=UPI000E59A643|nr:2OG-Fe(II) oxygenase [Taibaiella koreensis]